MRVLSIDWDFFIEEDPMLDFGHNENGLFLNIAWQWRRISHRMQDDGSVIEKSVDLTALLPFRGDEGFLVERAWRWMEFRTCVAESHRAILDVIGDARGVEIVNVDAHHDIYYQGSPPATLPDADCGSWGGWLIANGQVRSWHQAYPEWRRKYPEGHDDTLAWARDRCRFKTTYGEPRIPWRTVDWIFLCRSGCWTPPEYDRRFSDLCRAMHGRPIAERAFTLPPPGERVLPAHPERAATS